MRQVAVLCTQVRRGAAGAQRVHRLGHRSPRADGPGLARPPSPLGGIRAHALACALLQRNYSGGARRASSRLSRNPRPPSLRPGLAQGDFNLGLCCVTLTLDLPRNLRSDRGGPTARRRRSAPRPGPTPLHPHPARWVRVCAAFLNRLSPFGLGRPPWGVEDPFK